MRTREKATALSKGCRKKLPNYQLNYLFRNAMLYEEAIGSFCYEKGRTKFGSSVIRIQTNLVNLTFLVFNFVNLDLV